MQVSDPPLSRSSPLEQAAAWKVRLTSGEATTEDRAAFEAWLDADAAHRQAYEQVEKFWGRFDDLNPSAARGALGEPPARSRAWKKTGTLLSAVVALAAGWSLLQSSTGQYYLADYRTVAGEQRVIELDDRSRITLNTHSAIDVDYAHGQRLITLHQGEILLEVATDSERPFIVRTGHGTARALGTKYLVSRVNDRTSVAVIESAVRVCTPETGWGGTQPVCVDLQPDQGVPAIGPAMQPQTVDIQMLTSWTRGYLALDNRPLTEVLDELKRYRAGTFYYNDTSLADLRVSGVLPLDDSERALDMLARLLPVTVTRYPLLTVVGRRPVQDE